MRYIILLLLIIVLVSCVPPQNVNSSGNSKVSLYSPDLADLRKRILKSDVPNQENFKDLQHNLINFVLTRQSKGDSADYCFCHPMLVSKLFAPRKWEIVEEIPSLNSGIYTLRIDSSNKGGQQITALWEIFVMKTEFNDYCILSFENKNK